MLIRVSYTEDTVPMTFDESRNRTTRHLENEGWVEYIVAWRKDRLELYTDHVCHFSLEGPIAADGYFSIPPEKNGLQDTNGLRILYPLEPQPHDYLYIHS